MVFVDTKRENCGFSDAIYIYLYNPFIITGLASTMNLNGKMGLYDANESSKANLLKYSRQ